MPEHDLKIWPAWFEDVRAGRKPFEIRRDDRGYAVADLLHLREWDPVLKRYAGRTTLKRVTFVLTHRESEGLREGFVVLGIRDAY